MKIHDIIESKNYATLYHHTGFAKLLSILQKNALIAGSTGFVSFSRNKNFLKNGSVGLQGVGAMIAVDGHKLSNKYKIQPYKYHSLDVEVPDESEERIKITKVDNVRLYINEIVLYSQYAKSFSNREQTLINRLMGNEIDFPVNLNSIKKFITVNYPNINVRLI